MTTKLASKLPAGDTNGLGRILSRLVNRPDEVHVAICLLDTAQLTTDTDTGDVTPTVRIRAIEPVGGVDGLTAHLLLKRAHEDRTGLAELPFNLSSLYRNGRTDDDLVFETVADDDEDGEPATEEPATEEAPDDDGEVVDADMVEDDDLKPVAGTEDDEQMPTGPEWGDAQGGRP